MGVDVYMRWEGFGKEELTNPNYKSQITGYQDNGKAGYLRVSYGCDKKTYEILTSAFFWDWKKDIKFTIKVIEEFEEIVKKFPDRLKNDKKEWLDFAEFGRKLNKENKKPKVHISY